MCAQGLGGWALVQTVPGHQASDWEGSCGRQSEESQVHPQRHGPVGRRCRVLGPGEMRLHKNYPHAQTSKKKIPTRLWDRSTDTECGYRGNCPKSPQATARVCAAFIFIVGVLSSRKKEAAHSHVSSAHAGLQTARAGTRSPSLHQRVVWICVSVVEANVNAAISF